VPSIDRIRDEYERLRAALLARSHEAIMDLPLQHWAKPDDRYLPSVLVRQPLREVLSRSFSQLHSTPGIGKRKLRRICSLLRRALHHGPKAAEHEPSSHPRRRISTCKTPVGGSDAPVSYSDEWWNEARHCALTRGFGDETLGQFVSSLKELPVNLWEAPLSKYATMTLAEIRGMRGYGDAKVGAILGAFWWLHMAIARSECADHLALHVKPKLVREVETWLRSVFRSDSLPSVRSLRDHFLRPMLEQVERDGGSELVEIARLRLGLGTAPLTLDHIATRFAVTREGVRQKLVRVALICKVRWPEGQYLLDDLCEKAEAPQDGQEQSALLGAAFELFYPVRKASHAHEPRRRGDEQGRRKRRGTTRAKKRPVSDGARRPGRRRGALTKTKDKRKPSAGSSVYIHEAILKLLGED